MNEGIEIVNGVSDETGIPVHLILGKSRVSGVVSARHEAIIRVAELGWSTTRIGLLFNRSHTTICYALGSLSKKKPKYWNETIYVAAERAA